MSAVEDIGQMSAGVEQIDEPSQSVPNRIEEASDAGDILRPMLKSNSKELLLEDEEEEEEEEEESGEEDDGIDFCMMMVCGVVNMTEFSSHIAILPLHRLDKTSDATD
ncbi:hypothetical protein AAF712_004089 [Marasmius tenuissimus]|uniref:Uncharacterized protein n=1 Tax=Marasmius tenuissimus TaxID=585030 RepID=A0ABR3A465_9AGAR